MPVKNLVAQYTTISHSLTGLVIVFVAVRVIYKRFLTALGLGPDDWVMVVVALLCVPCTILNAKLAEHGVGRDVWTLTPTDITDFGVVLWFATLFYYAEIALLKASMLLFYLRIFPSAGFRRVVWATLVVVGLYGLAFILAQLFQCWPISDNWTKWKLRPSDPRAKCVDTIAIATSNSAISIALDIWMLCLPLVSVRRLNVSLHKKVAIASMFAVGALVTVVSVVRLIFLTQFRNSNNLTFDYTAALVWSTVEIATGVICACMPTVRLILIRVWPRIFDSRDSSRQIHYADAKPQHPLPARSDAELDQLERLSPSASLYVFRTAPLFAEPEVTTMTVVAENKNDAGLDRDSYSNHTSQSWKNRFYSTRQDGDTGNGSGELGRVATRDVEDSAELQPSRRASGMTRGSAASFVSSGETGGAHAVREWPLDK